MKLVPIFLLVLLVFCPSAYSAEDDGNEFLRDAKLFIRYSNGEKLSQLEMDTVTYIVGYVLGFLDGKEMGDIKGTSTPTYCLPKSGVKDGQVIRILAKYLEDHPSKLHLSGRVLLLLALEEAFPCKNEK